MVSYERSGITVDRCRECRGVFLDRGELDRIVDMEARLEETTRGRFPAPLAASRRRVGPRDAGGYDPDWREPRPRWREGDDERDWDASRPQRRRGLLGELFEGFGD
jgi:hypothetical protein